MFLALEDPCVSFSWSPKEANSRVLLTLVLFMAGGSSALSPANTNHLFSLLTGPMTSYVEMYQS